MKLRLLPFFLFIIVPFFAIAQVGIGTVDPHPSSILDISSPDKGILIPRIDLGNFTSTSPIANPVKSMMVWNTDASNGGANEGFYFYTGADWNTLKESNGGGSSEGSWSLSGNNINGSQFLGTTNYTTLKVKVNNNEVSSYHPNGGISIGFQSNANPNNALALGRLARANSNQALAIGYDSNASGYQSMAVGNYAKATSNNATAVGHGAEATGQNSIALGYDSSVNGQNATAVGHSAEATGQNSSAIGMGAFANQPNTLILGNNIPATVWEGTKVGIGTSTPNTNAKLDVNGNYKLGTKGSVHKNLMSFSSGTGLGNIAANGSTVIEITIPANLRPSSTTATLIVTPENGMNDNLHIAWTKLKNTNVVRIKLVNTSATVFHNPYVNFHISINEF